MSSQVTVDADRTTVLDWAEAFNIPIGIWMIFSSFLLNFSLFEWARIVTELFGALIILWAITRMAFPPNYRWPTWGNVLMGLFVAASPFILSYTDSTAGTINNVVCGLLVALIAATGFIIHR